MANEFEFQLENGQTVYTGMKMPETRPLLFSQNTAKPFSLEEAAELANDPRRIAKRKRKRIVKSKKQGRRSSCNAYATTTAFEKKRHQLGHEYVELAPEFVYAFINGGRDQGSLLPDGLKALCREGAPPREMVPYESYLMRDMSIEAKRMAKNYRGLEATSIPNQSVEYHYSVIVSEILRDNPVITARHVGNNGMRVDRNGVVGFDRGPGNHAEHADDVLLKTPRPSSWADFLLDIDGSWGPDYGNDGRIYYTIEHTVEPMKWHAYYSWRSVLTDPNAENPFLK